MFLVDVIFASELQHTAFAHHDCKLFFARCGQCKKLKLK